MNVFELQSVDERLQAIGHGLGRVWVDDEDRAHFAVSGIVPSTVFTHWIWAQRRAPRRYGKAAPPSSLTSLGV